MYNEYIEFLKKNTVPITELKFKSSDTYCSILEHVSYDYGVQYLKLIGDEFPHVSLEHILGFVHMNDAIGMPKRYTFIDKHKNAILCSPTSLRYIYHSLVIIEHFKNTNCKSMVEVGCGYGGLCLAIQYFTKIQGIFIEAYHLIDLQPVCNLIGNYLNYHKSHISSKLAFHASETYGNDIVDANLFFISNYCYTEIEEHHNRAYTKILFPKVSHGFITWQNGGNKGAYPITQSSAIIGKQIMNIIEEKPQTDAGYGIYKNYFTFF